MNRFMLAVLGALMPTMAWASDWRSELEVALESMDSDQVATYESAKPTVTRRGTLRFLTPELADPDAIPWVLAQVADPDVSPTYRQGYAGAAVRLLTESQEPAWKHVWVELVLSVEVPRVRHTLVAGLAKADVDTMHRGILAGLSHEDDATRALAAGSAALHPEGSRLASEVRAALRDASPKVRAAASRSLGIIGSADAVPDLVARTNDEHSTVRLHALRALERLDLDQARRMAALMVEDEDHAVRRESEVLLSR